jgi:hypothetical protein
MLWKGRLLERILKQKQRFVKEKSHLAALCDVSPGSLATRGQFHYGPRSSLDT